MVNFDDIVFDLLPADKKNFITQKQAVIACNEQGIPMSLRTFQLYLEKGILRKGFREGKEVYYAKEYIVRELTAVHILKTTFNRSIDEIQKLARYKKAYLYRVVEQLHKILDTIFLQYDRGNPLKTGRMFIEIVNEKKYQTVIEHYFKRVLAGEDYKVENLKDFINVALKQG